MKVSFGPRGILQIDDARIIWRNFEGRRDKFNNEGARNFTLIIPDQEIADKLMNDKNKYGVGWNVKIKAPREEGETAFMHLKVKVKFNEKGPKVYLRTGNNRVRLDEDTIKELDYCDILKVDLDIRPYDDEGQFGPFRSAYLHAMEVYQDVDRFDARFAEEEYPGEDTPW